LIDLAKTIGVAVQRTSMDQNWSWQICVLTSARHAWYTWLAHICLTQNTLLTLSIS